MRLDYSPIHAGFAYKTTEQLWHSRALLRCIVCSHDDAVLVHAELLVPVRCSGSCGETVRAQVAQAGPATRAGCAHSSGSVWAMNVHGYRSSRAALCCATDPPASVGTSVANCCYLRAGCCRTVCMGWCKTSGKVQARLRFTLRGQSAPSCAHCCVRMRIRCTRLSIPAANENAQLMCESSNYGRVPVATDVNGVVVMLGRWTCS